jgi:hypothetical protein
MDTYHVPSNRVKSRKKKTETDIIILFMKQEFYLGRGTLNKFSILFKLTINKTNTYEINLNMELGDK